MIQRLWVTVLVAVLCSGCNTPILRHPQLGFSESRRLVIAGENVQPEIAAYYKKKYSAMVWFMPYEGKFANARTNFFQSGLGPSRPLRALLDELKSINYTVGRWEIIVPKIGEKYFLSALKYMKTGALAKARGLVVLIDSRGHPEMEKEVHRVTQDNFFVTYENN